MTTDEIRGAYWRGHALGDEQSPAATEAALRGLLDRAAWAIRTLRDALLPGSGTLSSAEAERIRDVLTEVEGPDSALAASRGAAAPEACLCVFAIEGATRESMVTPGPQHDARCPKYRKETL